MDLSRRIRDLRYAKGWGPDELANRAKISRTALYQIERGNTSKPQAGTLRRISRALGVPLEILLEPAAVTNERATVRPQTLHRRLRSRSWLRGVCPRQSGPKS